MPDDAKRGRGRPPLEHGEPSTALTVRLPNRVYDQACRKATHERVSLPEIVRRALTNLLEDDSHHK